MASRLARSDPAYWYLVLHLYANRLFSGRIRREGSRDQSAALRAICNLLPTPYCRSSTASRGHDAPIRATADLPAASGEFRRWIRVSGVGAIKKNFAG